MSYEWGWKDASLSVLLGKTLVSVTKDDEDNTIIFRVSEDEAYIMYHSQDCCEHVYIESIVGDLEDLVGEPILVAEESGDDNHEDAEEYESYTWTFYKLATRKGYVDIRWFGSSNGYYSESVDFSRIS